MKIEKDRELGLCFGVKRAIKLLKEAAAKYGGVETLGPVAHNQRLVEELTEAGVESVKNLDEVQGEILAIATHGVSPVVLSEIETRHFHVIDTTCPIVRRAQTTAKELAMAGFDVIIFGEAAHSEVKGLLGWTAGKGIAALDIKQINISEEMSYHLGVISQTTQSQPAFIKFTRQLLVVYGSKVREMRIVNSICQETQRRQKAAIKLAKGSEVMMVIGGHNSANTKRLAEACSRIVETHVIERVDEVDDSWFAGKHRIGITAGTSTPDETIKELMSKLESL